MPMLWSISRIRHLGSLLELVRDSGRVVILASDILEDSGYSGLVLVLDEIETLQRVRGDVREKGLDALRQLIDDIDGGRFPNLYLLTTGTPAFFDGPQGARRLKPLAKRLHVDFQTDARFDNPRAVQLRLPTFDHSRLLEVAVSKEW